MAAGSGDEKPVEELPPRVEGEDRIEEKIDRDLRDSFPASDPPGWVLGVDQPSEGEEEEGDSGSPPTEEAGG
jgi:hypothetical protein